MFRQHRQIEVKLRKATDAVLFGLVFWLAHSIRAIPGLDPGGLIADFSSYTWMLVVVVPLGPIFLEFEGYYQKRVFASPASRLFQSVRVVFWVSLAVLISAFLRKVEFARGLLFLFAPLMVGVLWVEEELIARWRRGGMAGGSARRRLILLCGGTEGLPVDSQALERSLGLKDLPSVKVVATLDIRKLTPEQLAEQLHLTSANAVVISPRQAPFSLIEQSIQVCELEGVDVWLMADFFQTRISQTTADELNGQPMLVFSTGPLASWQSIGKGLMDRVGSFLILIAVFPIMLLTAIAIRLGSKGPVFFYQQRAGLNGHPFRMYKFRTMVTNAEQLKQELASLNEMSGPVFKITKDPRITPIGRFLRKWSIDELPQLWNVFLGDMSLVGPRPLPVDEVARFDDPAHRRRLSVKPGLTCLWQVSGRNNVKDFKEWVRLDLEYIDNWNLWLDVKILFRTVPAVFSGAGAR